MNQCPRNPEVYTKAQQHASDIFGQIQFVNLIGIDYVGIGSDFDGGSALTGCRDVSQMGNITLELVRRGYTKKDIVGIALLASDYLPNSNKSFCAGNQKKQKYVSKWFVSAKFLCFANHCKIVIIVDVTLTFHYPIPAMKNNIEAIIFDFGNVIIDIDPQRTQLEFERLSRKEGIQLSHLQRFDDLVSRLETGHIEPQEFRDKTRLLFQLEGVGNDSFDAIWNKLILDIPPHRIKLLSTISKHYRIFLLSNSNIIHYRYYSERFRNEFGGRSLEDLFEKTFFSFHFGLRKPDPEIYNLVIRQCGLNANQTVFIDDTPMNVDSANRCGLRSYHLKYGEDISSLFDSDFRIQLPD